MSQLASLPSPILFIGAAQSGKSTLAMESLNRLQNADIIGTCDQNDPVYTDRIQLLKASRPTLWHSHDAGPRALECLQEATSDQIFVDSVSQWLAYQMLVSENTDYDVLNQELKTSCQKLVHTVQDQPQKHFVLTTAEAGFDFAPQSPLRRLLRNRTCELNRELARVCRSVVHVVAGLPVVIKNN